MDNQPKIHPMYQRQPNPDPQSRSNHRYEKITVTEVNRYLGDANVQTYQANPSGQEGARLAQQEWNYAAMMGNPMNNYDGVGNDTQKPVQPTPISQYPGNASHHSFRKPGGPSYLRSRNSAFSRFEDISMGSHRLLQRYLQDQPVFPKSFEISVPDMVVERQKYEEWYRARMEYLSRVSVASNSAEYKKKVHARAMASQSKAKSAYGLAPGSAGPPKGQSNHPTTQAPVKRSHADNNQDEMFKIPMKIPKLYCTQVSNGWGTPSTIPPETSEPVCLEAFKKRRAWQHHLKCWSDQQRLANAPLTETSSDKLIQDNVSNQLRAHSSPNPMTDTPAVVQNRRRSLPDVPQPIVSSANLLQDEIAQEHARILRENQQRLQEHMKQPRFQVCAPKSAVQAKPKVSTTSAHNPNTIIHRAFLECQKYTKERMKLNTQSKTTTKVNWSHEQPLNMSLGHQSSGSDFASAPAGNSSHLGSWEPSRSPQTSGSQCTQSKDDMLVNIANEMRQLIHEAKSDHLGGFPNTRFEQSPADTSLCTGFGSHYDPPSETKGEQTSAPQDLSCLIEKSPQSTPVAQATPNPPGATTQGPQSNPAPTIGERSSCSAVRAFRCQPRLIEILNKPSLFVDNHPSGPSTSKVSPSPKVPVIATDTPVTPTNGKIEPDRSVRMHPLISSSVQAAALSTLRQVQPHSS